MVGSGPAWVLEGKSILVAAAQYLGLKAKAAWSREFLWRAGEVEAGTRCQGRLSEGSQV